MFAAIFLWRFRTQDFLLRFAPAESGFEISCRGLVAQIFLPLTFCPVFVFAVLFVVFLPAVNRKEREVVSRSFSMTVGWFVNRIISSLLGRR